jgi:SAM-dependent methyltransferase
VELGDFGRRSPALTSDAVSVYDALTRQFLRAMLTSLAGPGLVLGVEAEPGWVDVLPETVALSFARSTGELGREFGEATVDWVVLDRCLQQLPDPALGLEETVGCLKPGALLVSLFTGIARPELDDLGPLWSVAPYGARRLHEERSGLEHIEVQQYGNVALALAWLYRLPADGLTDEELTTVDPAYPVLVAVTATKRGGNDE